MGKLADELKKWLLGGGQAVQHDSSQAGQRTGPSLKSHVEPNWKKGVTPIQPSGQVAMQSRANKSEVTRTDTQAPASTVSAAYVSESKPKPPPKRQGTESAAGGNESPVVLRFGSSKQPSLWRAAEHKEPDAWVHAGEATQAPGGGNGRVLSVRMGIDFGTAYTKVAIRAADKVFFVPWSGIRQSPLVYLMPGELTRHQDDSLWLGRHPVPSEVRSDLKLPFLLPVASSTASQACAMAFLAGVMRYARAWLYHAQPSLTRGRRLAWEVNIGCPTNSWSSNRLRDTYRRIALGAWRLSAERVIGWKAACRMIEASEGSAEELALDGIHLMPEFIAQVAGYVRSPQRRNGLHMLMDVGAGTVDIATFNVTFDQKRAEDRFPIFASAVLPRGTHFLMAYRLESVGLKGCEWDDLRAIPERAQLAEELKIDEARLKRADSDFELQLRKEIQHLIAHTRAQRYGKAPEWKHGLPVFLSGGGAECRSYSIAMSTACTACSIPYRRTSFPLLEEAAGAGSFAPSEFHRLSVAYGLTFDAQSIGRILAPHEVDDAPAYDPIVDTPREKPDRDELYPR